MAETRAICTRGRSRVHPVEGSKAGGSQLYSVVVGPPGRERDLGYCTCLGFNFHAHCKHQDAVLESLCDFERVMGGKPAPDRCPKCGAPVAVVEI